MAKQPKVQPHHGKMSQAEAARAMKKMYPLMVKQLEDEKRRIRAIRRSGNGSSF